MWFPDMDTVLLNARLLALGTRGCEVFLNDWDEAALLDLDYRGTMYVVLEKQEMSIRPTAILSTGFGTFSMPHHSCACIVARNLELHA